MMTISNYVRTLCQANCFTPLAPLNMGDHVSHPNMDDHVSHTNMDDHVSYSNMDDHVSYSNMDDHVSYSNMDGIEFYYNMSTGHFAQPPQWKGRGDGIRKLRCFDLLQNGCDPA